MDSDPLTDHVPGASSWFSLSLTPPCPRQLHIEPTERAFLFSHEPAHDRPYDPSGVSHRYSAMYAKLGIDSHLHALRHYSATELLTAGRPPHRGRAWCERTAHQAPEPYGPQSEWRHDHRHRSSCYHGSTHSATAGRAGIRSPRMDRKPATWTAIDRDYENLRINMQTLFHDLGITTGTTAAAA